MQYDQEVRYSRHLILPEIGKEGQAKLLNAKVLVVGAGGLGAPALLYLAASGIGRIGIVDHDKVELSNLQRQILFETMDIGSFKTTAAMEALKDLNPEIVIDCHQTRLDHVNITSICKDYDIVLDSSDNIDTRYLINDYCYKFKKTVISAAISGFTGQLSTFKAYLGAPHPCYRCLYPDVPSTGVSPSCSEAGVLSSVAGIIGSWQATETIKEILTIGESLSGSLMIYDGLSSMSRKVRVIRSRSCSCCSDLPGA